MNAAILRLLPLLLWAAPGAAQEAADWLLPFRSPGANLVPPEAMFEHLRPMYEIAQRASPEQKRFDEEGVEVVDDAAWKEHHQALLGVRQDPGYLSLVLRESMHDGHRAIATYGMFYVPEPEYVFQLIAHLPGEPRPAIREDGYRRAVEYLEVHLPRRNGGDLGQWNETRVGPAGKKPPRPGDFSYQLDPTGFFALLDDAYETTARDHAQGLWFLGRCIEIRPALAAPWLDATQGLVKQHLLGGEQFVREAARTFVQICDPEARPAPDLDDEEDLARWFDEVVHTVLPPIRPVAPGLVELHPSDDVERLIAAGLEALRAGTLGRSATGTTSSGQAYRGFRLTSTPSPIDELGIPTGATITAINGTPIASGEDLLGYLKRRTAQDRTFLVEYVASDGSAHAKEFRRL